MLVWILKAALLQSLALVISWSLRHDSAATRRRVLICCVVAVCALPFVGLVGPVLAAGDLVPEALKAVPASSAPVANVAEGPQAATLQAEVDGMAVGPTNRWAIAVTAIWLIGLALFVIRWAVGLFRAHRLRRSGSPVTEDSWRATLARFTSRPVLLLLSHRIASPMAVGVLRPLIILPAEAGEWPESRLSMAIAHEAAHVRRFDTLWVNVSLLVRAFQWVNPLAWWLHRQLRLEMERSADEEVMRNGTATHLYAEFLLDLAARVRPVAELAMARPNGMEKRLRGLASMASQEASRIGGCIGLVVLGLSFGLGCLHAGGSDDNLELLSKLEGDDWRAAVHDSAHLLREDHPGADVRIGVMQVDNGELVASAGALDEPFASGSTVKPLTVAAVLEEGVPASTVLDCSAGKIESGGREFRDHIKHRNLTVTEVLARSSNVGTAQLANRIPPEQLFFWLRRLGVDTDGRVDPEDPIGAAIGISLNLSVKELLTAYATIANNGANPDTGNQVVRPETAKAVLGMLTAAVNGPAATGRRARIDGATVAGKTGTMDRLNGDTSHRTVTFVGLAPADNPRWVIAVAVDGAQPEAYGGAVAAPAFASIIRRALNGS